MTTIPMKTWTVDRVDGSTIEVTGIDYDAILDRWDDMEASQLAWMLDSGDMMNVIDVAVERIKALEARLEARHG